MKPTTILFDLDGTLLPMDQDIFVRAYFGGLAEHMAPHGYEPEALIGAIWKGTGAMVKNDGQATNEAVFWETFGRVLGRPAKEDEPLFNVFYEEKFQKVKDVCGFHPTAAPLVRGLRERGYRVILATNPIFPRVATDRRIRWAGLTPSDFDFYTTYENAHYCKPNLDYYREILAGQGLSPEACVMIGNDVGEDMIAEELGMRVFLLTDCMINKQNVDITRYPHGSFAELEAFLAAL